MKYASDYAQNNPGTRVIVNYSGGGLASPVKVSAIQYANARNVLVIASAGNNSGPVLYPAAYSAGHSNVIAVSATNHQDALSGYSNYGSQINVAGPGGNGINSDSDDIFSTTPTYSFSLEGPGTGQNYGYLYGTSMAAPHVAAVAGLMLSVNSTLTPSQLRNVLQENADDKGPAGFDNQYGHGRINALKATARSFAMANPQYSFITGTASLTLEASNMKMSFIQAPLPNLSSGAYWCDRYRVQATASGYAQTPQGWYLGGPGFGWANPNDASFWVNKTTTASSISLETVFYFIKAHAVTGQQINQWAPFDPNSSASRQYGVLGIPAPPLSVYITGPTYAPCATGTWTANASGGNPPYAYQWYHMWDCEGGGEVSQRIGPVPERPCGSWTPIGTNSPTLQYYLCGGNSILRVDVTDAQSGFASDQYYVVGAGGPAQRAADLELTIPLLPGEFSVSQNYPNPFNPETEISFSLPEPSLVRITVSDMLGREIMLLVDREYSAGYQKVTWKGSDAEGTKVGSGVYFYRIVARGQSGKQFTRVMKMALTK